MKKIVNIPLILALISTSFLLSCKDYYNICEQNRTSAANGNFYSVVNGAEVENRPASLVVTILNGPVSSSNGNFPASFPLILTPNVDSMSFTIKAAALPLDTIKIKYNTQLFTLSEDCGQINQFNILSISTTKNTIDSIRITKTLADPLLGNNFRVFY